MSHNLSHRREQKQTQDHRKETTRNRQIRSGRALITDTNALPEPDNEDISLEEIQDADLPDEEEQSDGGDDIPQDETESADAAFLPPPLVRPLWLLYNGRLIWASENFGYNTAPREQLRIRTQKVITFLRDYFPEKDDAQRLELINRLFVAESDKKQSGANPEDLGAPESSEAQNSDPGAGRAKTKSSANWLKASSLARVGIVCNSRTTPLKMLMGSQGSKNKALPDELLHAWFDKFCKKNSEEKEILAPKNSKWLYGELKDFCKKLREAGSTEVLGLAPLKCDYKEGTYEKKLRPKFRLAARQKSALRLTAAPAGSDVR